MLADFLDALASPQEGVVDDLPAPWTTPNSAPPWTLAAKYSPEVVAVYLQAFNE